MPLSANLSLIPPFQVHVRVYHVIFPLIYVVMVLLVVAAHWLPWIQYVHLLCTWHHNPLDHTYNQPHLFLRSLIFSLHSFKNHTHFKHTRDQKCSIYYWCIKPENKRQKWREHFKMVVNCSTTTLKFMKAKHVTVYNVSILANILTKSCCF